MLTTIRESEEDDHSSITNLIKNELGYKDLNVDKLYDRLRQMKLGNKYLTIVAENEGHVVGFVGIYKGIAYNYDGEYIQIIARVSYLFLYLSGSYPNK